MKSNLVPEPMEGECREIPHCMPQLLENKCQLILRWHQTLIILVN